MAWNSVIAELVSSSTLAKTTGNGKLYYNVMLVITAQDQLLLSFVQLKHSVLFSIVFMFTVNEIHRMNA
jgi:hypothetical protein